MSRIWVSSDTHFCHDREFIWGPRGFNSVHEMNEAIIKNWNSVVSWDDEVYLLGDIMLNNDAEGIRCLNRLAGKIYILTGNHDTINRVQQYVNIRPTILHLGFAYILKYEGYHFYLSHYPTLVGNYDDSDKPLNKRLISIAGHSHTKNKFKDMDKSLIYHAELDAHNCYPICLDNIIKDIQYYISLDKNDQKRLCENKI